MIAYGLPIYIAFEPVDLDLVTRLAGILLRRCAQSRGHLRFVFVGKRGHSSRASALVVRNWAVSRIIGTPGRGGTFKPLDIRARALRFRRALMRHFRCPPSAIAGLPSCVSLPTAQRSLIPLSCFTHASSTAY